MSTEKKEKKALIDTKQLGIDAISAGMVASGLMLGNVVNNLIPIENKLVKSAVILGVGGGSLLIPISNETAKKFLKPVMYGVAAYGLISLLRAAFVGDSVTSEGQAGIAGIGNNETVQKVVNMLLPNLGDSGVTVSSYGDHVFDIPDTTREIEDQEAIVMSGIDDLAGGGISGDAIDALAA